MIIFDGQVSQPSFMANLAFYRKCHATAWEGLIAGAAPFSMYGFQSDEATLVGSYNEGTSGVIGNMAWTNIALRSGDGWYASAGRMLQAGMKGFGMVNDGGATGHVGTVAPHSGNSVAGASRLTIHCVFRATSAGEGGAGVLFSKANAYRLRFSAANTLIFEVWDGLAWRGSDTGATVVYGYWHHLTIWFDGGAAALDRIKLILNGRDVTVSGAGIPAGLVDDLASILYVLDNAANTAAWNGTLGLLVINPSVIPTLGQAQSLIELRGLFQPTVALQPTIYTPGVCAPASYYLPANDDRLTSYQMPPVSTGYTILWHGSIPAAASADNTYRNMIHKTLTGGFHRYKLVFVRSGLSQGVAFYANSSFSAAIEGSNAFADNVDRLYAGTFDGTTATLYRQGQIVNTALPAGGITDSYDRIHVGFDETSGAIGCRTNFFRFYDRVLPQYIIQKIHNSNCRWYPES